MNLTTKSHRQRGHIAEGNAGLLSLIGLVVVISTIWYLGGEKQAPFVELYQSIEEVAASSTKTINLQLPQAGTLVVDLDAKSGPRLKTSLTRRGAQTGTLQVIEQFTADQVSDYRRSARLDRGDYSLNLVNSSPAREKLGAKVRISVRLRPRRRVVRLRRGFALGNGVNAKPVVANGALFRAQG